MRSEETAVSSVMGTSLMMLITVSVFAGFGVAVYGELETAETPPVADLRPLVRDEQVLLQHRGGEPVNLADGFVRLQVDGVQVKKPLTQWAADTSDGTLWRAGDTLCISCQYPSQRVEAAEVVVMNALLLRHGKMGAEVAAAPVEGPTPSLSISKIVFVPEKPMPGDIVDIHAYVTNGGTAVANASVKFTVNSVPIGDNTTAITPGDIANLDQNWTAITGTHTVKIVASHGGSSTVLSKLLTVKAAPLPPSTAYFDLDGDGAFTPGVDQNLTAAQADAIRSGQFDDPSKDLVLPPSFGPIDVNGEVDLRARSIVLQVDISATDDIKMEVEDTFAVTGIQLISGGHVKLDLEEAVGTATISGTVVQASKKIDINVEQTDLVITNTTLSSTYKVDVRSEGSIDLQNSTISSSKTVFIASDAADVDLRGANITTNFPVFIEAGPGGTIYLHDAILDDDDDMVRVNSSANVVGTPAFGGWTY